MENHDQPKENQTDFYQILGVDQDATLEEITEKYHKLSLLYHPDKEGGDVQKFLQISKAYKILKNPQKRKLYDNSLAATFNQLKEADRDTAYHVNKDYLRKDENDGNMKFDRDKFLQAFEAQRATNEDLIQEPKEPVFPERSLKDFLASRDKDLEDFRSNQLTDMTYQADPRMNNDMFNNIFTQYSKMSSTQVEAVDDKIIWGDPLKTLETEGPESAQMLSDINQSKATFQQGNFAATSDMSAFDKDYQSPELSAQTINRLVAETKMEDMPSNQSSTRVKKMDMSDIKKRLLAYQAETEELNPEEAPEEFFQVNFKDEDKLLEG